MKAIVWLMMALLMAGGANAAVCDPETNCGSDCSGLFTVSYNDSWYQIADTGYLCKPVGFENPVIIDAAECASLPGAEFAGCAENVDDPVDVICPDWSDANATVRATDCVIFNFDASAYVPVIGNETVLGTFDFSNEYFAGPAPAVLPFTGYVVGAEAIAGVGSIMFAVATLTGAIVAIIAAFAVLTLVTHTVKALSGPLTRGLE